jgi:hypothetical protein
VSLLDTQQKGSGIRQLPHLGVNLLVLLLLVFSLFKLISLSRGLLVLQNSFFSIIFWIPSFFIRLCLELFA